MEVYIVYSNLISPIVGLNDRYLKCLVTYWIDAIYH